MRIRAQLPASFQWLLTALLVYTPVLWASADSEKFELQVKSTKFEDTPASATQLIALLNESCSKAPLHAKQPADRRLYEMLINDLQDAAGKFTKPDALKVFAISLGRVSPEVQTALCFGLRRSPPNSDVDAAALKLLQPRADFKVKVAVMDLLAAHRDFTAAEKILPYLSSKEFPSVQICACRTLAVLGNEKTITALLKYLDDVKVRGNSRYLKEAVGALRFLTGQDLSSKVEEWKAWWAKEEKFFTVDLNRQGTPKFNFDLAESSELNFYDIPVIEQRLLFVFDNSGSMKFGGKPDRLESAKKELKALVSRLADTQFFNIVVFSSDTSRWQKNQSLAPANAAAKKDAMAFIDNIKHGGGTATSTAMEEALREVAAINGCETIYLITDGSPNPWKQGITYKQQERHITWVNQAYKLRINTIGIYTTSDADKADPNFQRAGEKQEDMKDFLYTLANDNDGIYKEIGK